LSRDYIEMINENWLSNVLFTTVAIKADLAKVKSGAGGDFQTTALSKAVSTPENNEATFLAWRGRATERKSTLVFCVDVQHIHELTATFRRHGVEAKFVTGETPTKNRSEILDGFKKREYPVLLNCGVFTEGTDIPNIDCVILARPTKSRNLLVQMIGRGTRLYQGKENCHVIDMVSSLKTGIVTTPTLFGLDPDELVKEASIDDMKDKMERKEKELRAQAVLAKQSPNTLAPTHLSGTMTFTDYDSVEDLIQDTSGEQHIRAISPYAWVQVDDRRYILATNSGSYLALVKSDTSDDNTKTAYHVDYTAKLPAALAKKSPFARPRTIASALTFSDAVHAADSFATETFEYIFIAKNQAWRRGPASAAQLKFLNGVRDRENQLEMGDVTKGMAMDMITKIKFGARGRWGKMAVGRRRVLKEQEELRRQLERVRKEEVRVGPVDS
jgi:ATP-dependent helicase IRC3